MTVGERLERAETFLMLARSACGNDAAQIFASAQENRDAVDRVLIDIIEDVYWARAALSTKCLNRKAPTTDRVLSNPIAGGEGHESEAAEVAPRLPADRPDDRH
jgi:hypothetical protein